LTKIGVDIGICLGNSQDNFQLHRFTNRDNTAKSFRGEGYFFDSHCRCPNQYSIGTSITMVTLLHLY